MVSRILRISLRTFLVILAFLLLYMAAAFLIPRITVNNMQSSTRKRIKIYVISNGVHTDIVLPVICGGRNWKESFPEEQLNAQGRGFTHIGFGWGDKGFYIDTPEWKDLKAKTAFNAVFGLGGTAMHVRYLPEPEKESEDCVALLIDEEQLATLIRIIDDGFETSGAPLLIDHPGYGIFDRFYEAKGRYSLFKTCNVWTGNALKEAGIKVAAWSPFARGLMRSLKP